MIALNDATSEVRRMRGLAGYPDPDRMPEAELELVKTARRARSTEHLREVVSEWINNRTAGPDGRTRGSFAPRPAELLGLILGPDAPKYRAPERTRCQFCGDSGWRPVFVLRTARPGGAGYAVQALSEAECRDLTLKVDWQRQTCYSAVLRCQCPVPSDPETTGDAPARGNRREFARLAANDDMEAAC